MGLSATCIQLKITSANKVMDSPQLTTVVHRILFWNPWSTVDFIAELAGFAERTVREKLAADPAVETIETPSEFGSKTDTVYALTRRAQLELYGRNIDPRFMAEALMMGYSRLRKGRDIIRKLHLNGLKMPWVISPWRPTRRGALFDGLLKVEAPKGSQMLVGVIGYHSDSTFFGEEQLVKDWQQWRKKHASLPATLLFWDPRFIVGEAKQIREFSRNENGDVVCFFPENSDPEKRWVYLNSSKFSPTGLPPWGRGSPSSLKALEKTEIEHFHPNIRKRRYPHAETFQQWLAGNHQDGVGRYVPDFLELSNKEIMMLRWLLLYPALDRQTFVEIAANSLGGPVYESSRSTLKRVFNQRIKKLTNLGYAKEIEDFASHYALTDNGMGFFSALSGFDTDVMAAIWGHPERTGKFSYQQEHQKRILSLIRKIATDGVLVGAGTESNRMVFYDIQRISVEIPRIEIRPDLIVTVRFDENKDQTFWIEVDRGTRKGRKIRWKLEKMFNIFYAQKKPFRIEPILYVVDCGDIRNEGRVRYILDLLKKVYDRYPNTRLRVLVTSADMLDQGNGGFLEQPIWREFYLGKVDRLPRSLKESMIGGAAQH